MNTFINDFAVFLAPIFYKLLFMSISAGFIGIVILIIRRLFDKKISPVWKYAMWLCVIIALVVPFRLQSNFAVLNKTSQVQEFGYYSDALQKGTGTYDNPYKDSPDSIIDYSEDRNDIYAKYIIYDVVIPYAWLFGMLGISLFIFVSMLRLKRKIKATEQSANTERYENALKLGKAKLNIKRNVKITVQSYIKTPALFSMVRPQIILPDYADDLSDESIEYIVLHELSHYKRGDHIVSFLLLALKAVYWFNPFVYVIFKFIRQDLELANDASVLKNLDKDRQKSYCLSLVEVLSVQHKPALIPKLLCMADNEKTFERRIKMMKLADTFKKRKLIISIASLIVISVVCTLFLTTGQNRNHDETHVKAPIANSLTLLSEKLYAGKTPYIGSATANYDVLSLLRVGDLGKFTIAMQTSKRPYILTVNFKDKIEDEASFNSKMQNKAYLILVLIENADEVRWSYSLTDDKNEAVTKSLNTEDASNVMGVPIKSFGESAEAVGNLLERMPMHEQQFSLSKVDKSGAVVMTKSFTDEADKQIISEAMFSGLLKPTANENNDLNSLDEYYKVVFPISQFEDSYIFYVYRDDGKAYCQSTTHPFKQNGKITCDSSEIDKKLFDKMISLLE